MGLDGGEGHLSLVFVDSILESGRGVFPSPLWILKGSVD